MRRSPCRGRPAERGGGGGGGCGGFVRGGQGTGAVEIGLRRDREKRFAGVGRRADRNRRVAPEGRPGAAVQRHGGVRPEHRRLVEMPVVVRPIDGHLCDLSRTGLVAR